MSDEFALPKKDNWLRIARKRLGFTQAEAGERVGLSENRWSEIEAGAGCVLDTALAIEKLTGVAPRDWRRTDPFPQDWSGPNPDNDNGARPDNSAPLCAVT